MAKLFKLSNKKKGGKAGRGKGIAYHRAKPKAHK